MRFAFFSRTDSEVRLRILEGRRSRLQERLDRARVNRGPAGTDRYISELQRHSIESVEREVRWLTDLIAAERAGPEPRPDRTRSKRRRPSRRQPPQARAPHPAQEREMRDTMSSVRVAIVGVGNCASSLVQGVEYYKDADPAGNVPGLMHVMFGDYHVKDVEFVAAFDVDAKKVGFDLSDAINNSENNTIKFCDVPPTGVRSSAVTPSTASASTTARPSRSPTPSRSTSSRRCEESEADVLVSYLPVGSENADKFYAQCAIDAGVAFVNALPVFIASDPEWAKKFEDAGVPIIGDDIK